MSANRSLPVFIPFQHYAPEDSKLKKDGRMLPAVKLKPMGTKLIVEYYQEKYKADIAISYLDSIRNLTDEKVDETLFKKRYDELLKDIKSNTASEYRKAILIGSAGKHALSLIYLRENQQEVILLSDSFYNIADTVAGLVKKIPLADSKIKFYCTAKRRQRDEFSCYADTLVMARDATAKDEKGNYRVPHLVATLIARSDTQGKKQFDYTRLPDVFLKTSQYPEHVAYHRENFMKTIHTRMVDGKAINETVNDYRGRYDDKDVVRRNFEKQSAEPGYLRKKGLKFANIIEIQFYINQLKERLKTHWNDTLRNEFIKTAKEVLTKQGDATSDRAGLRDFAEEFLKRFAKEIKVVPKEKPPQVTPPKATPMPSRRYWGSSRPLFGLEFFPEPSTKSISPQPKPLTVVVGSRGLNIKSSNN